MKPILDYIPDSHQNPTPKAVVCAWCLPGTSLFRQFPHLEGNIQISHGICPEHAEIQMRDSGLSREGRLIVNA
jgi:hypothetical protein